MKNNSYLFVLLSILFFACEENKSKTVDQLVKMPVKYVSEQYSSDSLEYETFLPKNWKLVESTYSENESFESFTDPKDADGIFSSITVSKYQSSEKDLAKESRRIQLANPLPTELERYASGKSGILKNAYYEHIRSTKHAEYAVEMVSFLIKTTEANTFYSITLSVPKDKDFDINMSVLLKCTKQFKFIQP